jgi:hypothetical protein
LIKYLSMMVAAAMLVVPTLSEAGPKVQDPMLNLSHIACLEDGSGVDAHFVLLFWGTTTPPTLNGTYKNDPAGAPIAFSADPGKNTGNVWHYDVTLPSGYIEIVSASVGSVTLHNPGEYTGTYDCGGVPPSECPIQVTPGGLCTDKPLTNPEAECASLGLTLLGKDDNLTGTTFVATMDAYVAIVKGGTQPCGPGNAAYNIVVGVSTGDILAAPSTQNISHVTYCACPTLP